LLGLRKLGHMTLPASVQNHIILTRNTILPIQTAVQPPEEIQKAIRIARGINRTNHIVYLILTTLMQMISLMRNKHESLQLLR